MFTFLRMQIFISHFCFELPNALGFRDSNDMEITVQILNNPQF